MINSPDNLDAVENGLKMIRTGVWLRGARIINIDGNEVEETTVPYIGTTVRRIPHQRFYALFAQAQVDDAVKELAQQFSKQAVKIVQPTPDDIVQAAKTYFVLKRMLAEEQGDALMMNCLAGLAAPRKHVPPCMGFMSLMNEGIAMGCESDLDGTLTMMLLHQLCGKPGFLHNSALDTEKNHYWGAHCTSPSRMDGVHSPPESYELMSHCEAGWGTVPRVHFREGQEVTLTRYLSWPPQPISDPTITARASRAGETAPQKPQLILYSGRIAGCPPIPPAGGCRTNVEIAVNELDRATDLIGNHMVMIYGNHVKQIREFCQLHDIAVGV
jgi:L-fucose isomerase-like protein